MCICSCTQSRNVKATLRAVHLCICTAAVRNCLLRQLRLIFHYPKPQIWVFNVLIYVFGKHSETPCVFAYLQQNVPIYFVKLTFPQPALTKHCVFTPKRTWSCTKQCIYLVKLTFPQTILTKPCVFTPKDKIAHMFLNKSLLLLNEIDVSTDHTHKTLWFLLQKASYSTCP